MYIFVNGLTELFYFDHILSLYSADISFFEC